MPWPPAARTACPASTLTRTDAGDAVSLDGPAAGCAASACGDRGIAPILTSVPAATSRGWVPAARGPVSPAADGSVTVDWDGAGHTGLASGGCDRSAGKVIGGA